MFRDINVLKLLPDRPGRGGTKFGYHSWQQEPINDTRQTLNVHVWQDSWRSDAQGFTTDFTNTFPDTSTKDIGSGAALALHGYVKYSLTSPSDGPMTEILGHNSATEGGVASGYIWNYSSYVDYSILPGPVFQWDQNVVCTADSVHPAVFANIGNRCFIATGISECMIYDSSAGNDVFGNGSGQPHTYPLGTEAPQAAPTVTPAMVTNISEGWLHVGSSYVTYPDPLGSISSIANPTANVELIADGITWDGANVVTFQNKTTTFSTVGMTVSIANGSNLAHFDPPASIPANGGWIMLTLNVNGFTFTMEAFGNMTPAEDPIIPVDACRLTQYYENGIIRPPHGGDPIYDPAFDIIDQTFTVTGIRFEMDRGGAATWAAGLYNVATPLAQIINAGGALTWDTTPPSYAYAWYDPLNGHISNISPVFSPSSTSISDSGVSIPLDAGSISYPTNTTIVPAPKQGIAQFDRFTHIIFFRTLMAGGSTLYPIGSLQPYIPNTADPANPLPNPAWKGLPNPLMGQGYNVMPPVATDPIWIDSARDADLLISGALRAPQFTNGKPKVIQNGASTVLYPAHMAYWDGRLWMAATQDPSALHYSCDRVQCPFGIPEESFADTNVLRIPAADGRICGMKLIGESLLVTTERWAYTVVGNNESNYRLVRVSTRMAGVGDYQMDEFVSDVEGTTTIVVFVGIDSKIYAMPLAGQAVWISKEIQTYLDAAQISLRQQQKRVRVHCMDIAGRRMVLCFIPGANTSLGKTFIYDFDQKVWTEHTLASDSSTTNNGVRTAWGTLPTYFDTSTELYAMPTPIASIGPQITKIRRWFDPTTTTPIPGGYIRTFPLTFDGKKTRKQVHFVRIYVNDQSFGSVDPGTGITKYPWRCTIQTDAATAGTPINFTDPLDTVYNSMAGGSPVDATSAAERIVTGPMLTGGPPLIGYTADITVYFPTQTNKIYQLYRVDVGWTTVGEEDP